MKFLPTEYNITYKTRLKEEEIIRRLSDYVEPENTFRWYFSYRRMIFTSDSTKSYVGQINGQTFYIKRINASKYSRQDPFAWLRISGIIEKDFDELKIKVKMRLPLVSVPVFGGIMLMIFFLCFSRFVWIIFGYTLIMVSFNYEINKSKKDLQTIFEADIIEDFTKI
jgi:hypothetical protein